MCVDKQRSVSDSVSSATRVTAHLELELNRLHTMLAVSQLNHLCDVWWHSRTAGLTLRGDKNHQTDIKTASRTQISSSSSSSSSSSTRQSREGQQHRDDQIYVGKRSHE